MSTPCRVVSFTNINRLQSQRYHRKRSQQHEPSSRNRHPLLGSQSSIHNRRKKDNNIKLEPENWCYQRYVWHENLDQRYIPKEKVIKTLIYGIRLTGNQSEYALREIARLSHDEASDIILNDTYVDDCISGDNSIELAHQRSQELMFISKSVVISGEDPPEITSEDNESIKTIGRMRWFP